MAIGDSNYSKVSALLHCNGTNGSTTFTDNSVAPKTFTAAGGAALSTAVKKYGTASIALNGTTDDVHCTDAEFDVGNGDFTIEWYFYTTSLATVQGLFFNGTISSNNNRIQSTVSTLGDISFFCADGVGGSVSLVSSTGAIAINTWYHVAIVRSGSTGYLFLDGVQITSGSFTINPAAGQIIYLGHARNGGIERYLTGYIDEFRHTKGVARYTSSFTAPSIEFANGTVITTGYVPITATPSSPTTYARSIIGNVSITVTPTSSLSYYDAHHRLITGDVAVIVTPVSPMAFVLWECDILGHGFDCWLNRMSSDITGIGFDCNASIEGDWSNIANITGYGFDCNAVIESGAELIGYGFYCSPDFTINAKEYAYITGLGFYCNPTITVLTSSNMWVTGVGFDCYAVIEGGSIINGYGFDCYPTISATVPEAINIAGLGFNCEPIISINVPTFISIVGHGFDADLWHGDVIGHGFDCTPRIAIITTVTNSQAFVVNTNTNAVSRFTNYPFANVVKLGDEYYGIGNAGFYQLTGDLDLTVAINGTIITKDMDMGAYESKRTQYVYLNSDTQIKITPYFDSVERAIHYSSFAGRKTLLGKGNSGRYQQYKFEQIKKLIDLEFIEEKLQRQVK